MPDDTPTSDAPPRPVLIVAVLLTAALAVTAAVIGVLWGGQSDQDAQHQTGPLPLVSIDAPEADSAACRELITALPDELPSAGDTVARRELAEPAPRGAAAWGEEHPVVLRCGLDQPGELTDTSFLRAVNGVEWLPIEDVGLTTWYAVDRPVYIALTVPESAGTGPLQRLSDVIAETLEAVPPRP